MDNCVIPSPNLCTSYVLYDIDGGGIGVSLKQPLQGPHQIIMCTANCVYALHQLYNLAFIVLIS